MGSDFSESFCESFYSFCESFRESFYGCSVEDDGNEWVKNIIEHGHPEHNCYIKEAYWNYKSVGKGKFHRLLQFKFVCDDCDFIKFVRMDKTSYRINGKKTGKKNICVDDELFKQTGLWRWKKCPKSKYNIQNLIDLKESAPCGYVLLKNDCSHFAKYIWKRIK